MAHFAELNNENIVLQVIVISNDVTHDEDGVEQEELGIAFCKSLYGEDTKWVQTSYNANFRDVYAMPRDLYDVTNDKFVRTPADFVMTGPIESEETPLAIE